MTSFLVKSNKVNNNIKYKKKKKKPKEIYQKSNDGISSKRRY